MVLCHPSRNLVLVAALAFLAGSLWSCGDDEPSDSFRAGPADAGDTGNDLASDTASDTADDGVGDDVQDTEGDLSDADDAVDALEEPDVDMGFTEERCEAACEQVAVYEEACAIQTGDPDEKSRPIGGLSTDLRGVALQVGADFDPEVLESLVGDDAVIRTSRRRGVVYLEPRPGRLDALTLRMRLRQVPGLDRELPTLAGPSGWIAVATPRLVVRFDPGVSDPTARLAAWGARPVRPLAFGENGFVAELEDPAVDVVERARELSDEPGVVYCAPDFLRPYETRADLPFDDPLLPDQWHLTSDPQPPALPSANTRVEEAWRLTTGSSDVVIAIADDGVDLEHEDLADAIVEGHNVPGNLSWAMRDGCCFHGTAVAGVAAAIGDNGVGVSGVCPECSIMPVFLIEDVLLEDSAIAEAFAVPAANGAAVINNSWGPGDGNPTIVDRPAYDPLWEPLSAVVQEALDFAETEGRDGLGTVVVFAAGNGNERVEPDPFNVHPNTISVAASDDQSLKSSYSDFGPVVDVSAPSDGGLTPGIVTTDAHGNFGFNTTEWPGDLDDKDYTEMFGGTSSATPFVAGVVALMISANPSLTAAEVREILRDTADPIDPVHGDYDEDGFSPFYGYGRVNVYRAVRAAMGDDNCVAFEEEECNGVDDTCDGVVDEGCPLADLCEPCSFHEMCESGLCGRTPNDVSERCIERCGDGDSCPDDFDCLDGFCLPSDGRCDPCADEEECNGVDDDCDGDVDEGDVCPFSEDGWCHFDAECYVGDEICLISQCTPLCSTANDCGRYANLCGEATYRYGEGDGDTKVCAFTFTQGLDCSFFCGQSSHIPDAIRNPVVECIEQAGDTCREMYDCVSLIYGGF